MTEYSKLNVVYRLQKWMDSVPGQTFLNYAYSWGASIVILGTLFKLTHLPGANTMLFIGMGTEVIVFFISAFDRPFDKTAIGRDLPTHIQDDEENAAQISGIPVASRKEPFEDSKGTLLKGERNPFTTQKEPFGTIIVTQGSGTGVQPAATDAQQSAATGAQPQSSTTQPQGVAALSGASPELVEAQANYVEELKKLTETLQKVSEQSQRLTRDSEEMETLNRTLTGICRVYEMQLKGASQQIGTIDQINEQSKKMAQQIEQLNAIYTRMIAAMTVNMRSAGGENVIK